MVDVKLISTDGSTEMNITQNYMGQGRPGLSVRYFDGAQGACTAEYPLEPAALGAIIKILIEGQSNMLKQLFNEMTKAMIEAEDEMKAEWADSAVIPFKRKD